MTRTALVSWLAIVVSVIFFSEPALAADGPIPAAAHGFDAKACAAIAMGVAALGGALGQGRAAASAFEGIGRNPGASNRIQSALILGLALIESVVLLAVVGCIYLQTT